MASELGAQVELERVPLKYHGLQAREIWISEAQERMVFAVPPEHEAEILRVFADEDVEATVIGRFEATGRLRADFRGTRVMDLDQHFLHEGLPRRTRQAVRRVRTTRDPALAAGDAGATLRRLLALPNVASKAWIIHQYDHEVQAGSVIKPLVGPHQQGPSDAAVCAPVLGSRRGFAVGCGINPWLGDDADPRLMALHAIDEALRNVVAVGGRSRAGLDPRQFLVGQLRAAREPRRSRRGLPRLLRRAPRPTARRSSPARTASTTTTASATACSRSRPRC